MIVTESLTKRYGRAVRGRPTPAALDELSISVPPGSITAIVGPNGAGKSTLFYLLLGFLHPSAGDIAIDGLDPRRYVRRNGAGYVPERFQLPADWRVRDALLGLAQRERLGRDAPAAVDRVLATFGLGGQADDRVGGLSRGTLQRVALAQAWLAPRALVVLDEPTEGLDPIWRLRFREELASLRAADRTIVLASHDVAEVERVADRAILLDGGRAQDTIDLRARPTADEYRIRMVDPPPQLPLLLPDATIENDGAVRVRVADAHELNVRLGALIEAGALIIGIEPVGVPLEERVRDLLARGDDR